ncbi:two-component regulator propeller domain-containing protein [Acanthopleuribacter pedis]|uniref:histidine kinase n=1 Tax=Acanthopleuribacter pedis TaxID=442870 RepID=A0A8J7U3V1_9BACT|nr:two-component regulator propeller domain-containing protein [Acanthopleuribacter pedis]MBO1318703.1 response regulator [Acanthopleuribacter pedis]
MKIRGWRATVYALFALIPVFWGMPLEAREQQVRFQPIAADEVPSLGAVSAVVRDRQGFMWFGTAEGLARFDGYEMKRFRHDKADPDTIPGGGVVALCVLDDGRLLLGTATGGLALFDPGFARAIHRRPPSRMGDLTAGIAAMVSAEDGTYWVATRGAGLLRFDPDDGVFSQYRHHPDVPTSLGSNRLHALLVDGRGRLWIGGDHGLSRYRGESDDFVHLLGDPGGGVVAAFGPVTALAVGPDGAPWVGTHTKGLFLLDPVTNQVILNLRREIGNPRGLSSNHIRAVQSDGDNRFWIGTDAGLNLFDAGTGNNLGYRHDPADPGSVGHDHIHTLLRDEVGNLWVGTDAGMDLLTVATRQFGRYLHRPDRPDSLIDNRVTAMVQDPFGGLWIGTRGGLSRYDAARERFFHFRANPGKPGSLPSNDIRCLTATRSGVIWVGTRDAGLSRFDRATGTFTRFPVREDGVNHADVRCLYEGRLGNFWVGTGGGGLFRFDRDSGRATVYRHNPDDPRTLANDVVTGVYEDREGRLWVGTRGGLHLLDRKTGRFDRMVHHPSHVWTLSNNHITALLEDSQSRLWVGTVDGLHRLKQVDPDYPEQTRWQTFGYAEGLRSTDVRGLLEDSFGDLWIATGKGLSKCNPETMSMQHWTPVDGTQPRGYHQGAAIRTLNGELCFGGPNGVTAFLPGDLQRDPHEPNVVLTEIRVGNRPLQPRARRFDAGLAAPLDRLQNLVLGHRDRVVTFKFAALHYAFPAGNRYRYQLVGFDRDWVEVGADQRFATYTELDPGRYTFRVLAANKDGKWRSEPRELRVRMRPAPWLSTLAVLGYATLLAALVYGRYRVQRGRLIYERTIVQRLKHTDLMKNQFLADTAHELRTPLNGIVGLAESLAEAQRGKLPKDTLAQLGLIARGGRYLAGLVDDILDFARLSTQQLPLQPCRVELKTAVDQVVTLLTPLAPKDAVRLENQVAEGLPPVAADPRRLLQILVNLVGNGIKFTEQGTVSVSAEVQGARLHIAVTDTGIGMSDPQIADLFQAVPPHSGVPIPTAAGAGLGLAITQALVDLHGGNIWAASQEGRGSTFTFSLPLADAQTPAAEGEPVRAVTGPRFNVNEAKAPFSDALSNPAARPLSDAQSFTLLVVDDEPVNRRVLRNHLDGRGYEVLEAADGSEALSLLAESGQVDLVLLDVVMPNMSGYEVCRAIRRRAGFEVLPVVFLSAKNQVEDLVAAFNVGGNDYITKPIAAGELLARIESHLQQLDVTRVLSRKAADLGDELARCKAELAEANQTAEVFDQIIQSINHHESLPHLWQGLPIQGAALFPGATQGMVWTWDREEDAFVCVAAVGRAWETLQPLRFSYNKLVNMLGEGAEPLAPGIHGVRHFNLLHDPDLFAGQPLPKALLTMTLNDDQRISGFLVLENMVDPECFDQVDPAKLVRFREAALSVAAKARAALDVAAQSEALVQARRQMMEQEKSASLGTLTAGIAHEITNPLNFINNFAGLTLSLSSELAETVRGLQGRVLEGDSYRQLAGDLADLAENAAVIDKHGKRADAVVASMMELARAAGGHREACNLNGLFDEYVSLTYQSLRAKDTALVIQFTRDFDETVGMVEVVAQSLSRVWVHLTNNAAESIREKRDQIGDDFMGEIRLQTRNFEDRVEVRLRDNGMGIARDDYETIFKPFYTTKTAGNRHVGLGLSICRDIIVQEHRGTLKVAATKDIYAEMIVTLPKKNVSEG